MEWPQITNKHLFTAPLKRAKCSVNVMTTHRVWSAGLEAHSIRTDFILALVFLIGFDITNVISDSLFITSSRLSICIV